MSRKYKFKNPSGIYFITFATVGWIDVFTRVEYKDIFVDSLKFCQLEKGLELFAWCLMTNHVHLIARAKDNFLLQDTLRDLKKFTSKKLLMTIKEFPRESRKEWMLHVFGKAGEKNGNNKYYQFWRQDNQPIELWSEKIIYQKLNYIHNNPVKARIVEFPEEYLYSSARNYCERQGLIDIELIV